MWDPTFWALAPPPTIPPANSSHLAPRRSPACSFPDIYLPKIVRETWDPEQADDVRRADWDTTRRPRLHLAGYHCSLMTGNVISLADRPGATTSHIANKKQPPTNVHPSLGLMVATVGRPGILWLVAALPISAGPNIPPANPAAGSRVCLPGSLSAMPHLWIERRSRCRTIFRYAVFPEPESTIVLPERSRR